jgi:signal transduction histidine kinase
MVQQIHSVGAASTAFAAAERASREQIDASALALAGLPVVQALLDAVGVSVVVLNGERQIIFGNNVFLAGLRAEYVQTVRGMRPGEALDCIHAWKCPGGCGTAPECATCGMVLATLASRGTGRVEEQECLMNLRRGGQIDAAEMQVHASQIEIEGENFTMVALRDISAEKRRAALQRIFLHDVANLLGTLLLRAVLLAARAPPEVADQACNIRLLAERMRHELEDQRVLVMAENGTLNVRREPVRPGEALDMAAGILRGNPVAQGRRIEIAQTNPGAIATDESLLVRVLVNMMKNALEATSDGGEVHAWAEAVPEGCEFHVWNAAPIPPRVALQVFKRSFSTKPGGGRGLGTFSMKLLGERYLGGSVGFTSTEADGTTFYLRLPA